MLILLPPSEGKAEPRRGRPLDLTRLTLPELTPTRDRLLTALIDLCADADHARTVLGLSPGQVDDVRRNAGLRTAPTTTVGAIYTGVLYDALGLTTLSPGAKRIGRALTAGVLWTVGCAATGRPHPVVPVLDRGQAARRSGRSRPTGVRR